MATLIILFLFPLFPTLLFGDFYYFYYYYPHFDYYDYSIFISREPICIFKVLFSYFLESACGSATWTVELSFNPLPPIEK